MNQILDVNYFPARTISILYNLSLYILCLVYNRVSMNRNLNADKYRAKYISKIHFFVLSFNDVLKISGIMI